MVSNPPLAPALSLQPDIDPAHDAAVEALYDRAFGPGRHAKAASRLREGNQHHRGTSYLGFQQGRVVGACRMWPVHAGHPALFLGPIAVEPQARTFGLGRALSMACIEAADAQLDLPILLVGDMSFFGAFGFTPIDSQNVKMPGPVDPARFLARGDYTHLDGVLKARWPADFG